MHLDILRDVIPPLLILSLSCSGGPSTSTPNTNSSTDISNADDSITEPTDINGKDSQSSQKTGALYVEIRDGADDSTPDCSKATPGADIDAAVMYSGPTKQTKARLANCRWLQKGQACDTNDKDSPNSAEGDVTNSPVTGFVSLNGGSIICEWTDNSALELGNLVEVYEVGAKDEIEPIRVRACKDSDGTQCGEYAVIDRNEQTVPAGKIL